MRRPRFRADYQPVRVAGETGDYLVVVGEHRHLLIEEPAAVDVVPLLDGSRTVDELAAAVDHPLRTVAAALRRLDQLGLLASGPVTVGVERAAGWDAREVPPDGAEEWCRSGRVLLVDAGSPTVDVVAAGLPGTVERLDIGVPDLAGALRADPDALVVVAPGSYLDPRLRLVNDAALAAGRPWILLRAHGAVLVLGPHLVPGATGCWHCLRQRWQDNEQVESFLERRDRPRIDAARGVLPATAGVAVNLLAAELPVLALAGRSPRLTGRMVTVDTRDLTTTPHELIRAPQCPACGDPSLVRAADPRVALPGGAVGPDTDGGSRLAELPDTYRRLSRHVSRYLGVVTRLDALAEAGDPTYSFVSGHNFAVARHPVALRRNLRGLSGGKGRTEVQAKVSAIAEAIERYSGVWRDDRPRHRASYAELGADRAVHPRDLLLFSDRQYAERERRNQSGSHFHRIPAVLADDRAMDWSTGWSLTHDAPRDLPAAYCWYGHPEIGRLDVCAPDSNGCAAGTTVAEAVLQGFGELVERDSVALWWYHRSPMPGVDLDSFADPWIDGLRAHYTQALHRELWVLDVTADLGIPTFAAVSRHTARPTEDVIVGFGSHLVPHVALNRALTEANQFLPIVARYAGGRTRYGITDPETVRWYSTVRVAEQPWLVPDPDRPLTTVDTYPAASTGDVALDVRHCVELASRAGIEVIVLNQSRPDLDLAVVKVVAPGLRHFWRRLGPGRLWRVPAALGREPAIDEDSVNPLSVFF